jgi:hypothetical protein
LVLERLEVTQELPFFVHRLQSLEEVLLCFLPVLARA